MGAAVAVLAATQAVDILLPEPAGEAVPSSGAALSSIPVGYGNPAFVQQLSSMVSSLEAQNLVLQEREQAALATERKEEDYSKELYETGEAQRLVRAQQTRLQLLLCTALTPDPHLNPGASRARACLREHARGHALEGEAYEASAG